jgi:hypothetical protein
LEPKVAHRICNTLFVGQAGRGSVGIKRIKYRSSKKIEKGGAEKKSEQREWLVKISGSRRVKLYYLHFLSCVQNRVAFVNAEQDMLLYVRIPHCTETRDCWLKKRRYTTDWIDVFCCEKKEDMPMYTML